MCVAIWTRSGFLFYRSNLEAHQGSRPLLVQARRYQCPRHLKDQVARWILDLVKLAHQITGLIAHWRAGLFAPDNAILDSAAMKAERTYLAQL